MTEQEIIEGNKLIAELMGEHLKLNRLDDNWKPYLIDATFYYHINWSSLMPVVEKIESMGMIVEISLCLGKMCRITKGSFKSPVITIANIESNSTIEAVWMSVVEFIKWYNQQSN